MENIGNFYERIRTTKRHTTQTDAPAITQAQSAQVKISGISMRRAASVMLTGLVFAGWLLLAVLVLDTLLFNNKLLTEVLTR